MTTNKTGVSKILHSARLAAQEGHQYFWIDKCCIDKSSSTELSEAINSMFQWYMLSTVCYAYLADLDASPSDADAIVDQFRRCRWLTRGWTLQELIAPGKLIFLNRSWTSIGTRASLVSTIEAISEIPRHILASDAPHKSENPNPLYYLSLVSVSTRLSWAGRRQTTRIEDEAYSLMGMFGINMPLVYGEGSNAFQRLQEELIRNSDDQSILAFRNPRKNPMLYGERMFAESPSWFLPNIEGTRLPDEAAPMSWTNRGLELDVLLCNGELSRTESYGEVKITTTMPGLIGILQCGIEGEHLSRIGIVLLSLQYLNSGPDSEPPRYFRRRPGPGTVLVFDPDKGEYGMCEDQGECKSHAIRVVEMEIILTSLAGTIKVSFKVHCCVPQRIFLESPMNHSVKVLGPQLRLHLGGTSGERYELAVAVPRLHPSQVSPSRIPYSWCLLSEHGSKSFWGYALIRKRAESGSKTSRSSFLACFWRLSFTVATNLKGQAIPGLGVIGCQLVNKDDSQSGNPFEKDPTTGIVEVLYHSNAKEIELAKPYYIYNGDDISISASITEREFLRRSTYTLHLDISESKGA